VGCWVARLAPRAEGIELREWDEILCYAQDDRQGKRAQCGHRMFVGHQLKQEMEGMELARESGLGRVAGPEPHRSSQSNRDAQNAEDRPLHAERIRRLWEAGECGAME
jgi:hypothetical protein